MLYNKLTFAFFCAGFLQSSFAGQWPKEDALVIEAPLNKGNSLTNRRCNKQPDETGDPIFEYGKPGPFSNDTAEAFTVKSSQKWIARYTDYTFNNSESFTVGVYFNGNYQVGSSTRKIGIYTVSWGPYGNLSMWLDTKTNKFNFYANAENGKTGFGAEISDNTIKPNQWYHVVITRNSSSGDWIYYINGKSLIKSWLSVAPSRRFPVDVYIGEASSGRPDGSYYMNPGDDIACFSLFESEMSPEEVTALMNACKVAPPKKSDCLPSPVNGADNKAIVPSFVFLCVNLASWLRFQQM